jgi:hypothetical protein
VSRERILSRDARALSLYIIGVIVFEILIELLIKLILGTIVPCRLVRSAGVPLIYQICYGLTGWSEPGRMVILYDLYPISKDVEGPRKPGIIFNSSYRQILGPALSRRKLRENPSEITQLFSSPQITDGKRIGTVTGLCTTRRQRDRQVYLIEIRNIITDV